MTPLRFLWGRMKFGAGVLLAWALVSFPCQAILPLPLPIEGEVATTSLTQETWEPQSVQGFYELFSASKLREKELPAYQNSPGTLGWENESTFVVPAALSVRVEFWKRIYTELTSSQALLHDSTYPELVYHVIDISELTNDTKLTPRRKARMINRLLKVEKKRLADKLRVLHALEGNPLVVPVELFPLFKKFEKFKEADRFKQAANRLRTQIGQRDRIVQGFLFGGRYFPKMMEIFEKKGLPKELTRLPLVESGFNLSARSKVGASGVWQFMRATGMHFLQINRAVDERNDPILAAHAAAELLKQNYGALESWPLAITAYNHGREGMAQAVRQVATKDLSEIIAKYKARTFGFASANFYSEFLAILEVERQYRKYFGRLLVDSPLEVSELPTPIAARLGELADACKLSLRELAVFNPALTDWVVSGKGQVPKGYALKVPPEKAEVCRSGFRNVG